VIGIDGSCTPLLSAVIAGSSQFVIRLVKIFATVRPDNRNVRTWFPSNLTW